MRVDGDAKAVVTLELPGAKEKCFFFLRKTVANKETVGSHSFYRRKEFSSVVLAGRFDEGPAVSLPANWSNGKMLEEIIRVLVQALRNYASSISFKIVEGKSCNVDVRNHSKVGAVADPTGLFFEKRLFF